MATVAPEPFTPYAPRRPLLAASGLLSVWIVILSLPMLGGEWLAGPGLFSDQFATGYAYRDWSANYIREHWAIPLWNPMIFGGLPYLGALHGDIFYPTSWLRLALPTDVVMNLGFVIHYIGAGVFVYVLLRMLGVAWVGAVVGGMAYQLSGVIGSYPAPGHDGKLFVTTLLPLACIALVLAMPRRRLEGYALLALTVGLGVFTPHPPMLYYFLLAAGLFALYLAFGADDRPAPRVALVQLAGALAAVVLGFGIGAAQVLPFAEYIPFSPRAETYGGFEGAASYAIPWSHVPEFFLANFAGTYQDGTYWAANPLKLHSEYLGLPVIALAVLGLGSRPRRRAVVWLGGIGLLFLLVCLGSGTPFFRLWYAVMPLIEKARAPGMALYVVALVLAAFAGFGTERLARGEGRRAATVWLAVGSAILLLGGAGVFGNVAEGWASSLGTSYRDPVRAARAAAPAIRIGALFSGLALIALGAVAYAWLRGRVKPLWLALALPLLVGADLWRNARSFWIYRDAQELYARDAVTERLAAEQKPLRVLDLDVYPGAVLMAHGIPQVLGHHGNELHRFDELLGGKNQWTNLLRSQKLWDLYAARYVLLPAGSAGEDDIPSYRRVAAGVPTTPGTAADLYEHQGPIPYARLVPGAVKAADDQAIATLLDARLSLDRVVILAPDALVEPEPLRTLPDPLAGDVTFETWDAGRMRMQLRPAAPQDAYVVVSENWYPGWTARVDGRPAPVLRGNVSLITVPVPRGAEVVELMFESPPFRRGTLVTLASLGIVVLGLLLPPMLRRRWGRA